MLPKGFEHDPVLLRSGSFPRPAATLFLGSESVALFSAVAISLSDVITAMAVQGGGRFDVHAMINTIMIKGMNE